MLVCKSVFVWGHNLSSK